MTQSPLWHRHLIDRVHGTLLHYCSSHVWCFERWVAHRQPTVCIALTHLPTLSCSSPTNPSPMACCNAHIYTNLNIYLYVYIILQKKSQGQETLVYSICTHIYMYIYIWIFCIHSIYTTHYKSQLIFFWCTIRRCSFMSWIEETMKSGKPLTEITAAAKLENFRKVHIHTYVWVLFIGFVWGRTPLIEMSFEDRWRCRPEARNP